jgi:hypothetical protein
MIRRARSGVRPSAPSDHPRGDPPGVTPVAGLLTLVPTAQMTYMVDDSISIVCPIASARSCNDFQIHAAVMGNFPENPPDMGSP